MVLLLDLGTSNYFSYTWHFCLPELYFTNWFFSPCDIAVDFIVHADFNMKILFLLCRQVTLVLIGLDNAGKTTTILGIQGGKCHHLRKDSQNYLPNQHEDEPFLKLGFPTPWYTSSDLQYSVPQGVALERSFFAFMGKKF